MTEIIHGAIPQPSQDAILPRWWRTIDKWSAASVLTLFSIGILLGLAASVPLAEKNGLEPFYYVKKQAFFGGVAIATMFFVSVLRPQTVRRLAGLGFMVALAGILALPFLGTDFGKGAVRWHSLGFASVQPSEFLKPGFVVVAAWMMAAAKDAKGPPGVSISFVMMMVIVACLALQPDFGQAALVLFAWLVMYFVAGAPIMLLIMMDTGSEHFARRIDGFLNPQVDANTQLGYAANAIREGGFFGVGVGEGQVKWSLPDAHTDFIIAVAAEEFGLVLVLFIIALYACIVMRSLYRLLGETDIFIRLAGTGLVVMFGAQAMINMGVAVRLLPAKGMTLPFISYGGSSLIAGGIALGMLLAFTRTRTQGVASRYGGPSA